MPKVKKIPKELWGTATAGGHWAVFDVGFMTACKIITRLEKKLKKKNCPSIGYLTYKGKKVYYCLYGIVEDKNTYSK